jgi:hypothetical protein
MLTRYQEKRRRVQHEEDEHHHIHDDIPRSVSTSSPPLLPNDEFLYVLSFCDMITQLTGTCLYVGELSI